MAINMVSPVIDIFRRRFKADPEFPVLSAHGEDHCKVFTVGLQINDMLLATACASSKKKARHKVANEIYEEIVKLEEDINNVDFIRMLSKKRQREEETKCIEDEDISRPRVKKEKVIISLI